MGLVGCNARQYSWRLTAPLRWFAGWLRGEAAKVLPAEFAKSFAAPNNPGSLLLASEQPRGTEIHEMLLADNALCISPAPHPLRHAVHQFHFCASVGDEITDTMLRIRNTVASLGIRERDLYGTLRSSDARRSISSLVRCRAATITC